jgi:acetyl-CoA carboxylase biotin carboxylase subunit
MASEDKAAGRPGSKSLPFGTDQAVPFPKVLVANRGEIAVRVIRALRELRIVPVAVYSDVDRTSLAVRLADEVEHIGPSPSAESYLNIGRILDAARRSGAQAIHPGYGFLSENGEFAEACEAAGIVFIGPSAASIRVMGSKTEARKMALAAGVPVVPGTDAPVDTVDAARSASREIGYPVMLKAAAGGGGKGMRRVNTPTEMEGAFRDASSEAERSFGDGAVYLEKFVENPRHIEIQVLGDRHGNLIHLGERECSLQRRHQKVVEECPSPLVAARPELRQAMGEAAIRAARAAGYWNAGTVEFLADQSGRFYFLEMNTRLQVEHPVTEMVTGIDLVHWQIRIAAGERLTIRQQDVNWSGAAMECRICAEDPDRQFFPSPGRIRAMAEPAGPGVRVDSGVYAGWSVPVEYDPLLAKLIVWAPTRELALERARRALEEYSIQGIPSNLPFFRRVLDDPTFRAGSLHTGLVEEVLRRSGPQHADEARAQVAAVVAALQNRRDAGRVEKVESGWRVEGRDRLLR